MDEFIIKLEGKGRKAIYRAEITGDPGRTSVRKWAQRYYTKAAAKSALTQIRNKYGRKFKQAMIYKY